MVAAALVFAVYALATNPRPARAYEIGHYFAGLQNVDDFFLPAPELGELIYAQYNLYYGSDTFRNHKGDKIDKITLNGPLGNPKTIRVNVDVDLWTVAPLLMWAPKQKIAGARYGAYAVVPFGGPSLEANLDARIGQGRKVEESNVGLADLFVQPLWLEWRLGRADVSVGYGFYAPTGDYKAGAPDNVGLGFWEHQIQGAVRVPFDAARTLTGVVVWTAEINHNKQDVDITPGPQMTVNWGLRKNVWNDWCQFAVLGYDSWQLADDAGSDAAAALRRYHDQVHAAGVQLGVPKLGLAAKYVHEYGARDRFEGQMFTLTFGLPLDALVDWVAKAL